MNNNTDKFAQTWWTIEDLDKFDVPDDKKYDLMCEMEEKLQDYMIEHGWEFIDMFLQERGYNWKK